MILFHFCAYCSQKMSQSQTNGTDGQHVSNSSNSSTSSRSRVNIRTSLVINDTSGKMKKSSTFSKNLRIPFQSKTGSTRSSGTSVLTLKCMNYMSIYKIQFIKTEKLMLLFSNYRLKSFSFKNFRSIIKRTMWEKRIRKK